MAFKFYLPDIGEGVIEGEVVDWKVAEGDEIELDQPMVEVQTDKATVEIPSPRKGRIAKINFKAGEICPVGDVLVVIDTDASTSEEPSTGTAASHGNGSSHVAQTGSPAVASGGLQVIDATGATRRILATPATRRAARELGIDITQVLGTGRNGRVTMGDIKGFDQRPTQPIAQVQPTIASPPPSMAIARAPARPTPALSRAQRVSIPTPGAIPGGEQRIPFRGIRRAIAQNMTRSKFTATHFTYVEEIDMTDLVELRTRAKVKAADRGVKLTYLPFIVKAVCAGLKKWPTLNASLDEERQELVRKHYYHIGLAAQGPQGLMVTVVRDADRLSIFGLATEIQRLADAVQSGSITRDELVGSTFTISSLGQLGGVLATPIINFPEAGIVGVHKMSQRPAVVDGDIVARWLMNLSISLDHRIVDGWEGAMFLADVKSLLEDPPLMFMEMV